MMRFAAALVCVVSLGVFAGACQSSTSTPEPAATGDGRPAGPPLVASATLAALLPTFDGWERTAPVSGSASLPAPASTASVTYGRGQAKIDLEITDTGGAPDHVEAMSKVAGTSFLQTAANGYLKGTTFGGFPAIESWNSVDHVGDLSLLINGRFIVHANGTGVDGIETVRALVERVDLQKVAGLR